MPCRRFKSFHIWTSQVCIQQTRVHNFTNPIHPNPMSSLSHFRFECSTAEMRRIIHFIVNVIFLFTKIIIIRIVSSNRGNSRLLSITYIDGLGCAGTHLRDWQLHYADDILWRPPPDDTGGAKEWTMLSTIKRISVSSTMRAPWRNSPYNTAPLCSTLPSSLEMWTRIQQCSQYPPFLTRRHLFQQKTAAAAACKNKVLPCDRCEALHNVWSVTRNGCLDLSALLIYLLVLHRRCFNS